MTTGTDAAPEAGDSSPADEIGLPDWRPTLRGVGRLAVVAALAGLVGLALAEIALRAAGLPAGVGGRLRRSYDLAGETVGPYRSGARVQVGWPASRAYEANFNSYGCRGAEPRSSDRTRILAVGDSMTFGYGVADAEPWPAQLDSSLAADGPGHPILNLSSGHLLIDDELRYLEAALPVYEPGIVILMMPAFGYGEPFEEGQETSHQSSRRRERARRSGVRGWYEMSAILEARLVVYLWREQLAIEARGGTVAHVDVEGRENLPFMRAQRPLYERRLREFERRVVEAGARLLLVPYPRMILTGGEISFGPPWTAELARRLELPFVDLYAAFAAEPDKRGLLLLPHDTHPSPRGHAVVAAAVGRALAERGWLE